MELPKTLSRHNRVKFDGESDYDGLKSQKPDKDPLIRRNHP